MIPEHTTVDVIGEVVAWEKTVNSRDDKGKTKRRMQIVIQDLEGLKLHVTLWDAFAEQFNEYVSIHKDEGLVVVVIQFAMVKIYREKPSLNSFYGTRLFINSEIDEIKDFRNSKDPSTRPIMASSSSSTSSIHKINFKYDVFLSFRGENTRTNFVDHLYDALKRQNIEAYKDDKNLDKGKKISKELIQAIEESRFHVIVFSKNYASSSWCLDELVKIMECQKKKKQVGQTVYPIFYDVEPTQVRKQSGEFGKAFSKHENDEAAQKWRDAMVEATSFGGRDLSTTADGHEVEFIKLVVKDISSKLPAVSADGNLIGMRTRINDMVSSLNAFPDELCMLGIWGMGGGGKTTLARAVFDEISFQFEGKSFVANVREVSKPDFSGLNKLQQQVLRDVSNDQGIKVKNLFDGKTMMKKKMPGRKVLVVLDDVDHIDQLKALAGEPTWFKPGSKIIITTRDKQVLVAHKVKLIHDVNLLTHDEAICLLSRCAFDTNIPIQGYKELSSQVVLYAAGLPLTITVLGSFLCGKIEDEWRSAIQRLETIPSKDTLDILEISYTGLEEEHKEIFLDVACILKGYEKEDAIRALESCGFYARIGLRVLEQKSLITSKYGWLDMHDRIEEMGQYIVRRKLEEPNKHSRLWIDEEIKDILVSDQGTNEAVRCIKLFMTSELNPEIVMKGLGNMKKLRFLEVYCEGVDCSNSNWEFDEVREYFPNALQCLRWRGYPFGSLPKSFQANNLVQLEMRYSKIEQLWEGGDKKVLNKLRFLGLRYSNLKNLDLGVTPNIKTLDLVGCNDLVELHIPVECLKLKSIDINFSKLKTLDLRWATNLETLRVVDCLDLVELYIPVDALKLKSIDINSSKLRTLELRGTPNLERLSVRKCVDLEELHFPAECLKLESLNIMGAKLRTIDLRLTPNLETLILIECYSLVELHSPFECLKKLSCLNFSGCSRFIYFSFRKRFESLEVASLSELDLIVESLDMCPLHSDNNLPKFRFNCSYREHMAPPSSIGNLEKLIPIGLCACTDHETFFQNICGLQCLTKLAFEGDIPEAAKDLGHLECLVELVLSTTKITHLPESICTLKHLKILKLKSCWGLEKLPEDLGELESLEELSLSATKITHLPESICMLKHLKNLKLQSCWCLEKLPEDLGELECLEDLILSECIVLRDVPNSICKMKRLKYFELLYCFLVEKLPKEFGCLECLKLLNIEGTGISHLPQSIFSLKGLRIAGFRWLLESFGFASMIQMSAYVAYCCIPFSDD